jgi:Ras-related protein Rab-24
MSRIYYRGAKAAIVCFDLTDLSSFERAKFWVNELKQTEEGCVVYLCGTKVDLVEDSKKARKVDVHVVREYSEEINARYMETSAKTGYNIETMFMTIAEDFMSHNKAASPEVPGSTLRLEQPQTSRRGKDCSC